MAVAALTSRMAREGSLAAMRTFAAVTDRTRRVDAMTDEINKTLARVERSAAPQSFKDAYREEMDRLFQNFFLAAS